LDKRVQVQLQQYLTLLLQWNARINLTAIRSPSEIIRRHFGESLFAARQLPKPLKSLIDFGSGAGFPGLPIQIFRPDISVTLAEANAKKVAFLREITRKLGLLSEIYPGRVESMPPAKSFSAVTLRAVEKMAEALPTAAQRVEQGGILLIMSTLDDAPALTATVTGFQWQNSIPIPESESRIILIGRSESIV
jgi:16S rRNA (guanine527-N7)-methyltransferase